MYRKGIIAVVIATFAWPAFGQTTDVPQPPRLPGYLGAGAGLDEKVFLPPPPADDSPQGKADLDQFRATRAEQGTARWNIAARDATVDPASMLDAFACAMGMKLRPEQVPALSQLLQRALADSFPVIGPPKQRYARPRPFLRADGPVCVPMSPEFEKSGSYPSGHSTVGWIYALILAELMPDRASDVLARGHAFGDSRVVCGVHYLSDVEAGYTAAAGLVAVLHANAAFKADMTQARAEIDRVRQNAPVPDGDSCAIEGKALYAQR